MQLSEASLPDTAFLNRSLGPPLSSRRPVSVRPVGLMVLVAALLSGCGFSQQDVLEAQLRDQQSRIRELQQELDESRDLLVEQDRDLLAARDQAAKSNHSSGKIAQASSARPLDTAWGTVAGLRIHGLTTGILAAEQGGVPRLNVVVQPLDQDGEVVKAAGRLHVLLSTTPGPDSETVNLAERELSITECRSTWNRGLVASGFHLQVPLQDVRPAASSRIKWLVTVTLDLGGGQVLSDSRLIDALFVDDSPSEIGL